MWLGLGTLEVVQVSILTVPDNDCCYNKLLLLRQIRGMIFSY